VKRMSNGLALLGLGHEASFVGKHPVLENSNADF
jgi:hypothetical protein